MVRMRLSECLLITIVCFLLSAIWKELGQTEISEKLSEITIIKKTFVQVEKGVEYEYDRFSPLIFLGGFANSGQQIIRAFLNMQHEISCDGMTGIIGEVMEKMSASMKDNRVNWMSTKNKFFFTYFGFMTTRILCRNLLGSENLVLKINSCILQQQPLY